MTKTKTCWGCLKALRCGATPNVKIGVEVPLNGAAAQNLRSDFHDTPKVDMDVIRPNSVSWTFFAISPLLSRNLPRDGTETTPAVGIDEKCTNLREATDAIHGRNWQSFTHEFSARSDIPTLFGIDGCPDDQCKVDALQVGAAVLARPKNIVPLRDSGVTSPCNVAPCYQNYRRPPILHRCDVCDASRCFVHLFYVSSTCAGVCAHCAEW